MSRQPTISIIICTCNRAEHLRQTLATLMEVCVPAHLPCELIVMDNASTDHTAEVVHSCKFTNMPLRYIYEPRLGKSYAYNTGMAAAQGEVFLFTDDDTRLPHNWIEGMCHPILSSKAHAVAGAVKIAPHLERSWMQEGHRAWLASTERLSADDPEDMVGANMAFSREVLAKVPGFDPELGPGALGFGEETLFAFQLRQAGYSITSAFNRVVEHHFDEARLSRASFIDRTKKAGETQAYIAYHWHHDSFNLPHLRLLKALLRLTCKRLRNRREPSINEGMPVWEIDAVFGVYFYKQYLKERKRPVNYEKRGLVKLRSK